MATGCINKVYDLYDLDEQSLLNEIKYNLEEKSSDEIDVDGRVITFKNNLIGRRSNMSLMAGIDFGSFELIGVGDHHQLIVEYSLRRTLIITIIGFIIVISFFGLNHLLDVLIVSLMLLLNIIILIIRYHYFVKGMIRPFLKDTLRRT